MQKKREDNFKSYYLIITFLTLVLIIAIVYSVIIGKEDLRLAPQEPIVDCREFSELTGLGNPIDLKYFSDTNKVLVVDYGLKTVMVYDGEVGFSIPRTFIAPRAADVLPNGNYLVVDDGVLQEIMPDGSLVWSSTESLLLASYSFKIESFYVIYDLTYLIVYPNNIVRYKRAYGDDPELISWDYNPSGSEYFVDVELVSGNTILVVDKDNGAVYDADGESGSIGSFDYSSSGVPFDAEKIGDSVIILEDGPSRIVEVSYSDVSNVITNYIATGLNNPRDLEYVSSLLYKVADMSNGRVVDIDCNPVVGGTPPVSDSGGSYTVIEGGQIELDGSESSDDGSIVEFHWKLDGNTLYLGPQATFLYTATIPGIHTLELVVKDNDGLTDSDSTTLTVYDDISCEDKLIGDHTLGRDLTCTENGVYLEGSDASLDCGGHTITGSGSGEGIVVADPGASLATLTGIEIKNCNLINFNIGILLKDVDNSKFNNNHVNDYAKSGIEAISSNYNEFTGGFGPSEGSGLFLNNSDYNTVKISQINYTEWAFNLLDSDRNTFSGLLAKAGGDVDLVYLLNSDNNAFTNIELRNDNTNGNGIYLADGSDYNFFDDLFIRKFTNGVNVFDARGNLFSKVDWEDSNTVDVKSNDDVPIVLVNPHLIDDSNGASSVGLRYDVDDGTVDVRWYVELSAEDDDGNELSGVDITVEDVNGADLFDGETNSGGTVGVLNFSEYIVSESSGSNYFTINTLHKFIAVYDGDTESTSLNISDLDSYTFEFEVGDDGSGDDGDSGGDHCVSQWSCEPWRECISGVQTRVCNDLNSCTIPTDEPSITMSCTVDDTSLGSSGGSGFEDQTMGEEGTSTGTFNTYYVIIPVIIILIITGMVLFWYFRKKSSGGRKTGFIVKTTDQTTVKKDSSSVNEQSKNLLKGDDYKIYSFIQMSRRHGYTNDKIRNALLDKGWDSRKIDKLLNNED